MKRANDEEPVSQTEEEEEHARGPPQKVLRSVVYDLQITVGANVTTGARVFRYNSNIMASHSGYIDMMLATSMKEREAKTITFPEIHPEDWEQMIKYLNPLDTEEMGLEEALAIVEYYDKYQFETGRFFCDKIASDAIIDSNEEYTDDFKCEIAQRAQKCNMKKTKASAVEYIKKHLSPEGVRTALTEDGIRKITPYFGDASIREKLRELPGLRGMDLDNLHENWFPKCLATVLQSMKQETLDHIVRRIRVTSSGVPCVDGHYTFDGRIDECHYNQEENRGSMMFRDEGLEWAIMTLQNGKPTTIFTAPSRGDLPLVPPRTGWTKIDASSDSSTPTIIYL